MELKQLPTLDKIVIEQGICIMLGDDRKKAKEYKAMTQKVMKDRFEKGYDITEFIERYSLAKKVMKKKFEL